MTKSSVSIAQISRKITRWMVLSCVLVLVGNALIMWNVLSTDRAWQSYEAENSPRALAMSHLNEAMGYGGMIHNFKNAVIRLDAGKADKARFDAGAALQALDVYERQLEDPEERAAVEVIRQTVQAYAMHLARIGDDIRTGTTQAALDAAVKINDGPALEALALLTGHERGTDTSKSFALNGLRRILGFGGMIHNFKNFVLRGGDSRREKVIQAAAEARQLIDTYLSLGANPEERQALEDIARVVDSYRDRLDLVVELRAAGKSVAEVDGAVKIDDAPALDGLRLLEHHISKDTAVMVDGMTEHFRTLVLLVVLAVASSAILLATFAVGLRRMLTRQIAAPANTIAESLQALAQGDTTMDCSESVADTEIGKIAAAAQVFRTKLVENQKLVSASRDAAARQEQMLAEQAQLLEDHKRLNAEQKATDATLKARQEALDRLLGDIDGVVSAGLEGDFSRRLPQGYDEQELESMAQSMNRLLENVERGLNAVKHLALRFSGGDLSAQMHGDFRGSFAELQRDFDQAFTQVSDLVNGLRNSAQAIAGQTDSIAGASASLSEQTEHQARAVESTAASLKQLSASLQGSAEATGAADQLVQDASTKAVKSGEVVTRAVEAMERIQKSSTEIQSIIGVIEDIAFQTNLLALNAGVEAARAGDAGRGFAVVASEVRSLAQRSSEAAMEISSLISSSGEAVKTGAELVNRGGAALQDIVEEMRQIATKMAEVATSSQQQAEGVTRISSDLSRIDSSAQHNAATFEETSAATKMLSTETTALTDAISVFTTKDEAGRPTEDTEDHQSAA